ncbi:PAS domain S-box protein [candidate division WWE3 bacterium]|uniref:histidine kinase n=1 Tax=candidate division WWE3 bacterium TaxID=2053526 RepID=A0A955RQP9_UNCKA|nr:PAS domain S-box protein [candidate division WWE3 bacterium]
MYVTLIAHIAMLILTTGLAMLMFAIYRHNKNRFVLMLAMLFTTGIIGSVIEMAEQLSWVNVEFSLKANHSITAIIIIGLIYLLMLVIFGIKVTWRYFAFFIVAALVVFAFGTSNLPQVAGLNFTTHAAIPLTTVALLLCLVLFYLTRRPGIIFFALFLVGISVGGAVSPVNTLISLIIKGISYVIITIGALIYRNISGASSEPLIGKIFARNISIRPRITVTFISIFIVVITTAGICISLLLGHVLTTEAIEGLSVVAADRAKELEDNIQDRIQNTKLLALTPTIIDIARTPRKTLDPDQITDTFFLNLKRSIGFNNLFFIDTDGNVSDLLNKKTGESMENISTIGRYLEQSYTSAKNSNDTALSGFYRSAESDNTFFALIVTQITDEDTNLGFLAAEIDDSFVAQTISNRAGLGSTGEILLSAFDEEGNAVFLNKPRFPSVTPIPQLIPGNATAAPVIQTLNNTPLQLTDSVDYRGKNVFLVTRHVDILDWALVVKIDKNEALAPVTQQTGVLFGLAVLAVAIFYTVSYFISREISRPIEELKKGIKVVQSGNFNYQVGTTARDEIGELSRAFDRMTLTLKETYELIDLKVSQQTKEIRSQKDDLEEQHQTLVKALEEVQKEKIHSEKLADDLQKFRLAVENTSDQIVISDADGIVIYANEAMERLTGYSRGEALGKKAGTLWGGLMPKEFYQNMWHTIKEDKVHFFGELTNKRKNGQTYIADLHIDPILNAQGEVVYFVALERDVTQVKEIDRMKSEFISLVSHQLRTPLGAIKWYLEMLIDGDAGKLTKQQEQFINNINDSNERMLVLVNTLLSVSRIESGRIEIHLEPVDLGDLFSTIEKEIEGMANKKSQHLGINVSSDLTEVMADPRLLRQSVINLVTNAIKYTPEEGTITVLVERDPDNEEAFLIEVRDTGYGIPNDERDQIFNKFYRASNVVRYETDGTGLGLYFVKAIIDASGGEIWFDSILNKGTTFWIRLPLHPPNVKDENEEHDRKE